MDTVWSSIALEHPQSLTSLTFHKNSETQKACTDLSTPQCLLVNWLLASPSYSWSQWNVLINLAPGEWGQTAWCPGGWGGLYKLVTCHQVVDMGFQFFYLLVTSITLRIPPHKHPPFQTHFSFSVSISLSFLISLLAEVSFSSHCDHY